MNLMEKQFSLNRGASKKQFPISKQLMKTYIKKLLLLPALIAGLGLIPAGRVTAQNYTTLYNFTGLYEPDFTNSDGAHPEAELILSGNTLYGTTAIGGPGSNKGTVFRVNTDGTGFTNLHSFTGGPDGGNPEAELILSGNTLYGTARSGGSGNSGTVFAVNTDGTGFTILHSFTATSGSPTYINTDGASPSGGLILSGSTLYGTAISGGSSGYGTVFKVDTDGNNFATLYSFTDGSDGSQPIGTLILSDNFLYGTAYTGGSSRDGTVFKVDTAGNNFATLHSFSSSSSGRLPVAGLILSGNTLYGTTADGGSGNFGTLFKVDTNGNNFTVLRNFDFSNGGSPRCILILSGNTLYGTVYMGGSSAGGAVFYVNTDGSNFTILHNFLGYPNEGGNPSAGLVLSGTTLYGTTTSGGNTQQGTVFSLTLPSNCAPATWPSKPSHYAGLTITGSIGCQYSIQYTANMGNNPTWNLLDTLTLPSSPYLYVDTNVLFSANRFYQAVTTGTNCAPAFLTINQYAGFNVQGSVGCQYRVEYTTNLGNPTWIPLYTFTMTSSPFLYVDTSVLFSANRFYQVVLVP